MFTEDGPVDSYFQAITNADIYGAEVAMDSVEDCNAEICELDGGRTDYVVPCLTLERLVPVANRALELSYDLTATAQNHRIKLQSATNSLMEQFQWSGDLCSALGLTSYPPRPRDQTSDESMPDVSDQTSDQPMSDAQDMSASTSVQDDGAPLPWTWRVPTVLPRGTAPVEPEQVPKPPAPDGYTSSEDRSALGTYINKRIHYAFMHGPPGGSHILLSSPSKNPDPRYSQFLVFDLDASSLFGRVQSNPVRAFALEENGGFFVEKSETDPAVPWAALKTRIVAVCSVFQNLPTYVTSDPAVLRRPPPMKNPFTRIGILPDGHMEPDWYNQGELEKLYGPAVRDAVAAYRENAGQTSQVLMNKTSRRAPRPLANIPAPGYELGAPTRPVPRSLTAAQHPQRAVDGLRMGDATLNQNRPVPRRADAAGGQRVAFAENTDGHRPATRSTTAGEAPATGYVARNRPPTGGQRVAFAENVAGHRPATRSTTAGKAPATGYVAGNRPVTRSTTAGEASTGYFAPTGSGELPVWEYIPGKAPAPDQDNVMSVSDQEDEDLEEQIQAQLEILQLRRNRRLRGQPSSESTL
jgi:hypothetical protein